MAKFLVQSGTLTTTVEAESSRKAALWAVHQAMQQVLPIDDSNTMSALAKSDSISQARVNVMEQSLRVSELGTGKVQINTRVMSTMDVVGEWNQMFAALDRLQRMLEQTGTAA